MSVEFSGVGAAGPVVDRPEAGAPAADASAPFALFESLIAAQAAEASALADAPASSAPSLATPSPSIESATAASDGASETEASADGLVKARPRSGEAAAAEDEASDDSAASRASVGMSEELVDRLRQAHEDSIRQRQEIDEMVPDLTAQIVAPTPIAPPENGSSLPGDEVAARRAAGSLLEIPPDTAGASEFDAASASLAMRAAGDLDFGERPASGQDDETEHTPTGDLSVVERKAALAPVLPDASAASPTVPRVTSLTADAEATTTPANSREETSAPPVPTTLKPSAPEQTRLTQAALARGVLFQLNAPAAAAAEVPAAERLAGAAADARPSRPSSTTVDVLQMQQAIAQALSARPMIASQAILDRLNAQPLPVAAARLLEQTRTSSVGAVHATTVTDVAPVKSLEGATPLETRVNAFISTVPTLNVSDAAPASSETSVQHALATHEQEITRSIVQTMRMQWSNGAGSAVVSLNPEYLGEVTIALDVNRGAVEATLHAANPDVRAWLQANEASLRQGLAAQGLSLGRFNVSDEVAAKREAHQQDGRRRPPQAEPEPRRHQRRDSAQTFNVVV